MIEETQKELPKLFSYLLALVKNPVEEIRTLPEIHWTTLVAFQFCLSLVSVVISNLLAPYAISLINVLISLSIAMIATGLVSLFFYYFFMILFDRQLPFIKIFTLILFANIPFAIFHLAAYFFPPSDLIGLGISGMLMIVGLVSNFHIPKKLAMQLIAGLYSIFFVFWMATLISSHQNAPKTTPQDLDQMEKEVQDFFKE